MSSFKIPFFNQDQSIADQMATAGNTLLNVAIGLGPLGFAGSRAISKLQTNNPNFLSSLSTNSLGDIHSSVGESFERHDLLRKRVRGIKADQAKKVFANLDTFLDDLNRTNQDSIAGFLSSLNELLRDPKAVSNEIQSGNFHNQVKDLLHENFGEKLNLGKGEQRETLKGIIDTIVKSDPTGVRQRKLSSYKASLFGPVSDLLVAPQLLDLSGLKANVKKIDTVGDLSMQAQSVFEIYRKRLGGADFRFISRSEKIADKIVDIPYVQIFKTGSDPTRARPIQTLPLNLREAVNTQGVVPMRFGSLNTAYAGTSLSVSAGDLNQLIKGTTVEGRSRKITQELNILKSSLSSNQLTSNSIFHLPEVALAHAFTERVSHKGGLDRLTSRDVSMINADIQQMVEYQERYGYNRNVNTHIRNRYIMSSMGMTITNPMALSAKDRAAMRPALSQVHNLFDFGAEPFSSGHFGTSVGNIGIRTELLKAAGIGTQGLVDAGITDVLGKASRMFGGELVTRGTLPITARFRQMYGREEEFHRLMSKKSNRVITLMDVTGKERLGIGEGMGVYFGDTDIIKPVNKPIYAAEPLGVGGSLITEEIKARSIQGKSLIVNQSGEIDFVGKMKKGNVQVSLIEQVKQIAANRGFGTIGDQGKFVSGGGGIDIKGNRLIYSNIDDFYRLFGSELDNYGIYLGVVDGRRQIFERYTGITGFQLGLAPTQGLSEIQGTSKLHIVGHRKTSNAYMKLFGSLFKGIVELGDRQALRNLGKRTGYGDDFFNEVVLKGGTFSESKNINPGFRADGTYFSTSGNYRGLVAAEGSMLKKSAHYLAEQIGSSMEILGGDPKGIGFAKGKPVYTKKATFSRMLEKDVLQSVGGVDVWKALSVEQQQYKYIAGSVTEAARRYQGKAFKDITGDPFFMRQGLTFGAFKDVISKEGVKEGANVYGLTEKGFREAYIEGLRKAGVQDADRMYGEKIQNRLYQEISRGYALGYTGFEIGPQASTLGQNMGSMESRLYNFMSYKLSQNMGLDQKAVSNFMFGLLARKQGTAEDIKLLKEVSMSMDSIAGRTPMRLSDLGIGEAGIKPERIDVMDFLRQTQGDEQDMRRFLEKQKGGFVLNLDDRGPISQLAGTKGNRGFRSKEIYLPAGQAFLDLLDIERTLIPAGEGGAKEIDAQYIRNLFKFSKSLVLASERGGMESTEYSLREMREFKESMADFFGQTFRKVLRGKVRGSTFAIGTGVNLGRYSDEVLFGSKGAGGIFEKTRAGGRDVVKLSRPYDDLSVAQRAAVQEIVKSRSSFEVLKDSGELGQAGSKALSRRLTEGKGITLTQESLRGYLKLSEGSLTHTARQKALMRKIQGASKGTAIFAQTEAFFSAMSTFMGGATDERAFLRSSNLGADPKQVLFQARRDAKSELAGMMERFFLGNYDLSSVRGDKAIFSRHPIVGTGHVSMVNVFRDVAEGGRGDIYFRRFAGTTGGQREISRLEQIFGGTKIESFGQVAALKQGAITPEQIARVKLAGYQTRMEGLEGQYLKMQEEGLDIGGKSGVKKLKMYERLSKKSEKMQKIIDKEIEMTPGEVKRFKKKFGTGAFTSFFSALSDHMGDVSVGSGGGRVIVPEMMVDIHYGDRVKRLDLSIASGMIGDFDGDIYQLIFPTRRSINSLNMDKKLISATGDETLFRARTQLLFEMAGRGIKEFAKELRVGSKTTDLVTKIADDALKEQLGKNVGPLDVALDAFRISIINTAKKETLGTASSAINLLAVIQEVANLKAKHLPKAVPIAEVLSTNLRKIVETGGESLESQANVRQIIKDWIFREQDLTKTLTRVDAGGIAGGADIERALLNKHLIHLDDTIDYIFSHGEYARKSGALNQKTERRLAMSSLQEHRATHLSHQGMLRESVVGRMMGTSQDLTIDDMVNKNNRLIDLLQRKGSQVVNKGGMGTLGTGLMASMGLASLIGYGGYSPEPLLMPGEIVTPEISGAISSGSAFQGHSPNEMENMQNLMDTDIMKRPINIGHTLMETKNAWQIRGEAVTPAAMRDLSNIVGYMGGRSHVTINDTRRPMTQNYINRVFFEE